MAAHLHHGLSPRLMNNVRQFFQIGDIFIVVNQDPARFADFAGTGALDNYQTGAAFGTFGIIS